MDFIAELRWRGLFFDMIPGTDKLLRENFVAGYIGFDPSAPSLGIGNLVQIMLLRFFQNAGHRPVAVLGGATGMIGDPSGKSAERNLLSKETLLENKERFKKELSRFIAFGTGKNDPLLLDNYSWYKDFSLLDFLRDIGKHIPVNYMLSKDSVKSRMETGISFTEFSYQLLQAYDFYWLFTHHGVRLQMGGSDQWGNITTGVELIRRLTGENAYAITSPLITKPDGTKFGKTEQGNIFLNPELTSPYRFYQFWINVSDEEAEKYIKIFTFLSREVIEELIREHRAAPHQRILQKELARSVTTLVHSEEDYHKAVQASEILFGKGTQDVLQSLSEKELLDIFDGVPLFEVPAGLFDTGTQLIDLLTEHAAVFPSRSEVRRILREGGLSINKEKMHDEHRLFTRNDLLNEKYLLIQKGKKNYFLIVAH
ncbi:MAG: tyrosine--tRNA ligase [Chitinophagales bacterium]|nr:MAG: tyrosine--tRNA ligase [Chitinophagales bacterium]